MEFKEVMRQRNRMCRIYYGHCTSCPLNAFQLCAHPEDDVLPAYEAVIMGWAKENPEQKYPTWIDWQQKVFPTASTMICPKIYMSKEEANCFGQSCYECTHSPIPKEIAEKLGIKPKE